MSERDRGMAIAILTEGFKVTDLSAARIRIYERGLRKVPVSLLEPMAYRAIETRKPRWGDLPTVAELLEDAEHCRREALKQLGTYDGCLECEGTRGWVSIVDEQGVPRMRRCDCFVRHQQKREALGGNTPLALPPAQVSMEGE